MGWIGVVTDAGNALLQEWARGPHTLTVDGATVGSGNTIEANMRQATELAEPKDTAEIVEYRTSGQMRIQVGAASQTVGSYKAKEIGIWAHVGDGEPVLFALHQSSEGVDIPLASVSPNFAFGLYCIHAFDGGSGNLTVNITGGALVTQSQLAAAREEDDVGLYVDSGGYLCQGLAEDD